MLENQPPPHQYKDPKQQTRFKLDITQQGDISFDGDMSDTKTQELLQQALQQAEYYKQKTAQLESEKIKQHTEIDSVVIVFVSCVLALLLFGSFMLVSSIRNAIISNQTGVTQNVR
jgi:hypothetical protein